MDDIANRKNIVPFIALAIAILIVLLSFIILKRIPESSTYGTGIDKAGIIYKRAESFLSEKNYSRAAEALVVIVNKYPDSKYAEKSLRELASIYHAKGDYGKARYYYSRLLKEFPKIKDSDKIKKTLDGINVDQMLSPAIAEDSMEYEVQQGDTLYGIARKYNTTIELLKKVNGLESSIIRTGQKLKVVVSKFSILVDKATNRLVLSKDGNPFKTYAVSTGKNNSTPVGVFTIEEKMVKPVWYKVGAVVSPESDEYELGARWIGISAEGYGIHGTSDESTIGQQVTQGCVRMYNNDVVELYEIVPSGTEVEIIDSAAPIVDDKKAEEPEK